MTSIKSKIAKVSHLNALRAFEATARHQSFSAAALELDVTPAAVSQLIKSVEHSLGVTLFTRAKGGSGKVTLTAAGELAYPDISAGFKLIQSGINSLRRITDETTLSIAVSPAFASKWLIPRLGDFRSKHPEIEIIIHMNSIPEDYIGNGIDLGIRYGAGTWSGLTCEGFLRELMFPVCSPDYLKRIQFNDNNISGATLIHDLSMGSNLDFTTWDTWLDQSGVTLENCQQCIKINNSAAVLQACIDGQGLALARSVLALDDIVSGKLVVPFNFEPKKIELEYFIVYRTGFEKIKKVRTFRDWLKSCAIEASSSNRLG